jgi:hypothetical protein
LAKKNELESISGPLKGQDQSKPKDPSYFRIPDEKMKLIETFVLAYPEALGIPGGFLLCDSGSGPNSDIEPGHELYSEDDKSSQDDGNEEY